MRELSGEEYKQIVIEILDRIDNICKKHRIGYSLAYGTLLGAIRHNGFIPWDDDADILMMREEYDKLREIINSGDYGLKFIDYKSDSDTIYPFGKICDLRTHVQEQNFIHVKDYGAFVDVFPLDYLPEDETKRTAYCRKYRRMELIITHATRTGFVKSNSIIENIKKTLAFHMCHFINYQKMIKRMQDAFISNNKHPTSIVGVPWCRGGISFPVEYFTNLQTHLFEGREFLIPVKYDNILKTQYGDYMKLPPEKDQVNPHNLICQIRE